MFGEVVVIDNYGTEGQQIVLGPAIHAQYDAYCAAVKAGNAPSLMDEFLSVKNANRRLML